MNKKWLPLVLVILLAITLFFVRRWQASPPVATDRTAKDPASHRGRGFDRRISYIEYTQHAKCRMQCRHISQAEVEQIMQEGNINYRKSDVNAHPCPTYAVEGLTKDDQRVRIVFGQCNEKTKVITVIDLETDWSCDCPGDDAGYKNKK